ncbi:MAG: hypothetical protein ACKOCT_14620, partial [Alphaproteobacteria bacterium]
MLALASRALAVDLALVEVTSLKLQDDVTFPLDEAKRRITFKSATKRASPGNRIVAPLPGGPSDPTVVGATLVVANTAGGPDRVQVALPAAGWRLLGTSARPAGWSFEDKSKGATVSKVSLKDDLLGVKGGGGGFASTLDELQQGRVGLRLDVGASAWCADAPAQASGSPPSTSRSDAPGRFTATKSPPPSACGIAELRVTNGYGSGFYAVGSVAHVWAAVRPANQLVTGWTGDADLLEDPEEWHTTLVMPARDATVGATVVDRPIALQTSTYTGVTARQKTVRALIPAGARGLVLMLHGTGGSADYIIGTEAFQVALRALEDGYGVLGTEAEEAVGGDLNGDGKRRWDPSFSASNTDFGNLNALVTSLRSGGQIGPTTPLFVLGMSNGGAMALSLGAVGASSVAANFPALRFAAAISFCASGRASAAAVTMTPTAFLVCGNDDNDEVSNADAAANSAAIAGRGVPSVYAEHPASPLYDERFMRTGLSLEISRALAHDFRAAGFVRDDGFFGTPSDDIIAAALANPSLLPTLAGLPATSQGGVVQQVGVMQA